MLFKKNLIKAKLIKRYKRFLADVELESGEEITIHTANTGTMMGCSDAGSTVWISDSMNPKRKYLYSWEITETSKSVLVGINTWLANSLVREGVENGVITELSGYDVIQQEVTYGKEKSRIDLLLSNSSDNKKCYVEVKNVTAVVDGMSIFPDAKSIRGVKHLRELMYMVDCGHQAVLCFCVQRCDSDSVRPADEIDPLYGETLRVAAKHGVNVIAYEANVTISGIELHKSLPIVLA